MEQLLQEPTHILVTRVSEYFPDTEAEDDDDDDDDDDADADADDYYDYDFYRTAKIPKHSRTPGSICGSGHVAKFSTPGTADVWVLGNDEEVDDLSSVRVIVIVRSVQ